MGNFKVGVGQPLVVLRGDGATPVVPLVDLAQLDAQHGGVQFIEAAVVAQAVMGALRGAVIPQDADPVGHLLAVRHHRASVSEAAEVFLDDEAEADRIAQLADGEVVPAGADRLGIVLDDEQVMGHGDLGHGAHLCRLPVEVHRHNSLGARA